MENKKIVYVTGCLGFIGSYVTRACLEKGWYVKGIDMITYAANVELLDEFNKFKNFSFEKFNINDLKFLYDCDYVINTAAETHVDNSIESSDIFLRSNINGVHNLLELIKQKRYKKPILFHFSTDEVYGDIIEGSHKETDLLKPSNPYSATKAAADMLIKAWSRTYNIPYIIVRPTNNYGCGQYVEKLIPKSCKFLKVDRKIPLHSNGTPVRIWLHAKDTANAVIKIIESGVENEIYNISGNYEDSNINVIKKILSIKFGDNYNINDFVDFTFNRSGQDVRYSIDDSKLRKLGWTNLCKFDTELPDIINYYEKKFVW
jgi:dTDP-glucose 4,6-dehydratase